MKFADIHLHALFGCDDGPDTKEEMFQMIDLAYRSGTRLLCLTPHCHPGCFGDNSQKSMDAFGILRDYAARTYPDLALYLGNELRCQRGCEAWLDSGICRTLNGGRHVLVDFREDVRLNEIENGLRRLLNGGYVPVLAHVERYRAGRGKTEWIRDLRRNGVVLQMDAGALTGQFGFGCKLWAKRLLKDHLIDLISSDGHDLDQRQPQMDRIYTDLKRKHGSAYANALCWRNALKCLEISDGKDDESNG